MVIFDRRYPRRGSKPDHVGYAPFAPEIVWRCMTSKCHEESSADLFDHLVGRDQQVLRNSDIQCLGCLQINGEFEPA